MVHMHVIYLLILKSCIILLNILIFLRFLLVSFVLYEKGDTLLYNIFKFLFSFF